MEKTGKNSSRLCQGFILYGSSSFAPGTLCGEKQTALQGSSIGIRDPAINGKYLFTSKMTFLDPVLCFLDSVREDTLHCNMKWSSESLSKVLNKYQPSVV